MKIVSTKVCCVVAFLSLCYLCTGLARAETEDSSSRHLMHFQESHHIIELLNSIKAYILSQKQDAHEWISNTNSTLQHQLKDAEERRQIQEDIIKEAQRKIQEENGAIEEINEAITDFMNKDGPYKQHQLDTWRKEIELIERIIELLTGGRDDHPFPHESSSSVDVQSESVSVEEEQSASDNLQHSSDSVTSSTSYQADPTSTEEENTENLASSEDKPDAHSEDESIEESVEQDSLFSSENAPSVSQTEPSSTSKSFSESANEESSEEKSEKNLSSDDTEDQNSNSKLEPEFSTESSTVNEESSEENSEKNPSSEDNQPDNSEDEISQSDKEPEPSPESSLSEESSTEIPIVESSSRAEDSSVSLVPSSYTSWDPETALTNWYLGEEKLRAVSTTGSGIILATVGRDSGKWSFEVTLNNDQTCAVLGIAADPKADGSVGSYYGFNLGSGTFDVYNNQGTRHDFYDMSFFKPQDTISVAVDLDEHRIRFAVEGRLLAYKTIEPGKKYFPMARNDCGSPSTDITANFGHQYYLYPTIFESEYQTEW